MTHDFLLQVTASAPLIREDASAFTSWVFVMLGGIWLQLPPVWGTWVILLALLCCVARTVLLWWFAFHHRTAAGHLHVPVTSHLNELHNSSERKSVSYK